ncbi:hypothetical protein ABZ470_26505 [Streptosporangium sp. NPDC020072]|uniref:hypothetical protein n=1 Tax=Streptosporangium sp. NPDC020072 TaxID=3154788 RepID=UPI00342896D6
MNILAAIGALTVTGVITLGLLVVVGLRAERRRLRSTRDYRATRPTEQVAKDPAMWSDYFLDHDLHKVLRTPKEWT